MEERQDIAIAVTVFLLITVIVLVLLHFLGILILLAIVFGIAVLGLIILAVIISGLLLIILTPYYLLRKKPRVEEYGEYSLEHVKGKNEKDS